MLPNLHVSGFANNIRLCGNLNISRSKYFKARIFADYPENLSVKIFRLYGILT